MNETTKNNPDTYDGYEVDAAALLTRIHAMRLEKQPLGANEWMLLAKSLQERLADDLATVTEDEGAVDTICDLCWSIDGLYFDTKPEGEM